MKNYGFIDFKSHGNKDIGYLTALEQKQNIPFEIKRVYYIADVPKNVTRGYHAHKKLEQVLICVSGSIKIKVDNGSNQDVIELNKPNKGLYIDSLVWREMYDWEENTVLMVLASDYYDEDDYIRDYEKFLSYKERIINNENILQGIALETIEEFKMGKQYQLDVYIHEKAIVDTKNIGASTRVWGFTHILKGAEIGRNCNICEHVFIENDVKLENNVTVKCGVYIWDGIHVEDDVFIGPCVTFVNDLHPRSKKYPEKFERTIICRGSSLGANSTIMGGVRIDKYATVGAGSVVLKDVKPYEIVVGNPARYIGYNCKCGVRLKAEKGIYKCRCGKKYRFNGEELEALD